MRKPAIIVGAGAALVLLVALALGAGRLGLVCVGEGAGGPGTTSTGPVTLATDHTIYAPSDAITVTVTNHLDKTIYLASANCPFVTLDKQEANGWSSVPLCHAHEAPPSFVESASVESGMTLWEKIDPLVIDKALALGTYRLRVAYSFSPVPPNTVAVTPGVVPVHGPVEVATSALIRVCTCRSC